MAYLFTDGFDNYNVASSLYEYVSGTITYGTAYRRFAPPAGCPGQGILIASNGASVRKNLPFNSQTHIIKGAFNFAALGGSGSSGNVFLFIADSGTLQWYVSIFPNGSIAFVRGNGSIEIQTAPSLIAANAWYGIEVEVTIAGSASTAQAWINGVQVVNATGLNLQYTADDFGNQVGYGDVGDSGLVDMMIDDVRVWDSTGSYQNAPAGASGLDSRIITKMPSGAGALTNWTPNGAAANWQCVDDNPPDGDTTYVSNSTASTEDAYAMPSAGFTEAPLMVVARGYLRKDDSATRSAAVGVDSSGSTALGPTVTIGSTYQFIDGCISLDPHISGAWTAASADAAQHLKQEVS